MTEENVNMEVKPFKEEEVFEKPKKKRVLTDAQKEALAKGRARVKANREAKKKDEIEKQVLKEKQKDERSQLKQVEKQKAEALKEKKAKLTAQEKARQRILERKAKRTKDDDNTINKFNDIKYSALSNLDCENKFDKLDHALSKYLTRNDILKGNDHIKGKLEILVQGLEKQ
jgi:hypothetical protein